MNNVNSAIPLDAKVLFIQNDYGKYPRGLAVVETEKTSAHRQAEAMVGSPVEPCGFYIAYGSDGSDVIRLPRFGGWVGSSHPDAKEVTGPFVAGEIRVTMDRLPEGVFAMVTFTKN